MTDPIADVDALLGELQESPAGCLVPGHSASDVHDTIYRLKKAYLRLHNECEHAKDQVKKFTKVENPHSAAGAAG